MLGVLVVKDLLKDIEEQEVELIIVHLEVTLFSGPDIFPDPRHDAEDGRGFEVEGGRRYVNPGDASCSSDPTAGYCSLEIPKEGFTIEHLVGGYDRTALFQDSKRGRCRTGSSSSGLSEGYVTA